MGRIEEATGIVGNAQDIHGRLYHFCGIYVPESFSHPKDYNQLGLLEQYRLQQPLGLQIVFQLEVQCQELLIMGDCMEANWDGCGKLFPATIIAVHISGLFDMHYNNNKNNKERAICNICQYL